MPAMKSAIRRRRIASSCASAAPTLQDVARLLRIPGERNCRRPFGIAHDPHDPGMAVCADREIPLDRPLRVHHRDRKRNDTFRCVPHVVHAARRHRPQPAPGLPHDVLDQAGQQAAHQFMHQAAGFESRRVAEPIPIGRDFADQRQLGNIAEGVNRSARRPSSMSCAS